MGLEFGNSPEYNISKERRFDGCGKIEIYMDVTEGIIKSFNVYGDYFGNGNIEDIAKLLIGHKIEENEIKQALTDIDIKDYFNNLKFDDFVNLIIY